VLECGTRKSDCSFRPHVVATGCIHITMTEKSVFQHLHSHHRIELAC
jgi:hypothetical protein